MAPLVATYIFFLPSDMYIFFLTWNSPSRIWTLSNILEKTGNMVLTDAVLQGQNWFKKVMNNNE